VTQQLVKKNREANLVQAKHEEDKAHQQDPSYNDSLKTYSFSSTSHILFKVE